MKLFEKAKKWANDHAMELVVGGAALAVAGVGAYLGYNIGYQHHQDIMAKNLAHTVPEYGKACYYAGADSLLQAMKTQAPELAKTYLETAFSPEVNGFDIWPHMYKYDVMKNFSFKGDGSFIIEDKWFNF